MTVTESGWQPADLAATFDRLDDLLDQAAQAHAEALVEAARDYGYLRRVGRTITTPGRGEREIVDPGTPMTWLAGKTVPLRDLGIIRRATAAAIAAGGWRYPGRVEPMEQADQDPRVRAVAEEWRRRLSGEE